MTLFKKLLRTMWNKKGQYISAWLLVVISSMVFYACTAAGANLIENLDQFFKKHQVEDAQFIVSKPIGDTETIEKNYHAEIEKRISFDAALNETSTLRLLDETKSINQYKVIDGKEIEKSSDLLLDPSFAKEHNLEIGDSIFIHGNEFIIKGTMAIPDYIYPLKSYTGFLKNAETFGVGIVQENAFEKLPGTQTYYSIRFNDRYNNDQNSEALKKHLNKENTVIEWVSKEDNNRISFIKGDIEGIKKTGETLPIGLLLITVVIIMIVLWRLLKSEYTQIGTLYALGYKKSEIVRHYVGYSFILAIFGSAFGTLLGWFLLEPLLNMFAAFYNLPVLTIQPHLSYLFASLLLPIIFFVPLTYILVRRVLRIPPVVLMKGGEIKTKINPLEKAFKMKRFSFGTRFRIREILRGIPRITFLTIGIIFSTLLILIGFVTNDSMDYLINDDFKSVYNYNYKYTFNEMQTQTPIEGEIGSTAPFTLQDGDKQSIIITAMKKNQSMFMLKDIKGNQLSFDSVIVNKSLADKLNLKQGDTIQVKNELNGKRFSLKIDHLADSYLGDIVYMPLQDFNHYNGLEEGSYTELYSKDELKVDTSKVLSVTKKNSTIEGYKQLIQPIKYAVVGIAVAAGVISIIIIYVLISLLIEENTFKISLMKVLGYDHSSIRKLMIDYNLIFVILGFLIGIPVTLASTSSFFSSITAEMNLSIPVKVYGENIWISFGIILIAYFTSIVLNQRKLKLISMHEAINKATE